MIMPHVRSRDAGFPTPRQWDTRRAEKRRRQGVGARLADGKVVATDNVVPFLEAA